MNPNMNQVPNDLSNNTSNLNSNSITILGVTIKKTKFYSILFIALAGVLLYFWYKKRQLNKISLKNKNNLENNNQNLQNIVMGPNGQPIIIPNNQVVEYHVGHKHPLFYQSFYGLPGHNLPNPMERIF